jgi:DNA invertase Pin-like site-specific DNA recombinase
MNRSELVTPDHLARKAIIYIRQSSPHQVLNNQESLRLQYALQQRAVDLGWREDRVEVVDADLGLTAAAAQHREGFKEVLARVTLGEVGIILSIDVTRLSRNCSDWYPLLDLCGFKGCLIADRDGIYDPATPNGRLLLGLKGQISEAELHTIRSRLRTGIINKAQRGELALSLPVGLVRDEAGVVSKEPNLEVRSRIELVFATFLQLRTVGKVVRSFATQGLDLPRRDRFREIVWRRPKVSAVLEILKNPAYAGAFVYGRTRTLRTGPAPHQRKLKPLSMGEWRIRVNDKYPAYINWETYEKIQVMLRENYAEYDRERTRGVPRPGAALLQGLVYCGECGRKMIVQYKPSARYQCNQLRQEYYVPVCQNVKADPVDARVVEAYLAALSPVELDIYAQAMAAKKEADASQNRARQQQLERLRYQVELARRQYSRVDPDNRLVAAELERRWEEALQELKKAEELEAHRQEIAVVPIALSAELKAAFSEVGRKLPELWPTEVLSREQKKGLLRCLIEKVVIRRVGRDRVQTRVVWRGGEVTEMEIPITVGALAELSFHHEMEERLIELFRAGKTDEEIAAELTQAGYRSPMKERVIVSTVVGIRRTHGLRRTQQRPKPRRIPAGYVTLPQMARTLGVSAHWIYDRIKTGRIKVRKDKQTGLYLFPEGEEMLSKLKEMTAERRADNI